MTEQEFPYLTSLHINDCYTYQDFDIPIGTGEDKPFRHLILTGKNGSGKTTILASINEFSKVNTDKNIPPIDVEYLPVKGDFFDTFGSYLRKGKSVYKFFKSHRGGNLGIVKSPISEEEFQKRSEEKGVSELLKQFLVNKKVNQAFEIIENNGKLVHLPDKFFDQLESVFQDVFDDKKLKLTFSPKEYEFYIEFSDKRRVTLNQLSDGFSAFVRIILDLLVRVDMIQKTTKNNSFDPPGLVLIDEPETHLHLEMQYQVMPLLTRLFPNIQFIVATHSPAVVSSIKDATVFDLTTKEVAKDWVVGSSFSELMQTHFGLDNEFSNIADGIMAEAERISDNGKSPKEKLAALQILLEKNRQYLSPEFHLSLESTVIQLEEELESA